MIAAANDAAAPISAVLPVGGELPAKVAAAAARRLGLPANAPAAMASTANKLLMREQLAAAAAADAALRQPRFFAVACGTDPGEVADRVTAPGGVGISLRGEAAHAVGQPRRDARRRSPVARGGDRAARAPARRSRRAPAGSAGGRAAAGGIVRRRAGVRAGGHPDPRRASGPGAVRQARPARRAHVRGDHLCHAVAVAGRRSGPRSPKAWPRPRARSVSRPARFTPSCAGRPATTGPSSSSWPPARSEGCAREACALNRAFRWRTSWCATRLARATCPRAIGGASGVMMIPTPARVPSALRAVDGIEAARAVAGIDDVVISVRVGETLVPLPEGTSYTGLPVRDGRRPRHRRTGAARRRRAACVSPWRRWCPSRVDAQLLRAAKNEKKNDLLFRQARTELLAVACRAVCWPTF